MLPDNIMCIFEFFTRSKLYLTILFPLTCAKQILKSFKGDKCSYVQYYTYGKNLWKVQITY